MKTVVSNDMVLHFWAHQAQTEARNSGNSVHFQGASLYSYSTCIGYHVDDFVLLSRNSMSHTTGKHIYKAARACRHLRVIYSGYFSRWDTFIFSQKRIVEELIKYYEENMECLTRKRTPSTRGHVIYSLRRTYDDLEYLKNAWGMEFDLPSLPDNMEEILEAAKKFTAQKAERERQRIERQRIKDEQQYKQWLNGEYVRFPDSYRDYRAAQLTIRGGIVYTSQGAEAPLHHVRKALEFYFLKRWPYQTNGHRIPLGHFVLDSIDENGNVKAGCHHFKGEEIERFASKWSWHFQEAELKEAA